ncbi:MAG: PTS sugar transporter subunit IIB [Candidatus Fimousia sp.]|nr:PTS sugar transporter subunit IIB [Anaerostipes sp.]
MKNVVLARVDDRLIHGEVVSVWTPSLNVNRIIVVDDEVAADKFNKRVIKALAPNGVKVNVYGTERGAEILQKDSKDPNEKVMILTKTPITYARMVDMGLQLKEVNLGGMGLRGERTPFIKNVACSPDEIESIKHLMSKNVHVYYQLVPEQQVIEVTGYIDR